MAAAAWVPIVVALIALVSSGFAMWSTGRVNDKNLNAAQANDQLAFRARAYEKIYEDRLSELKERMAKDEIRHLKEVKELKAELARVKSDKKDYIDQLVARGSL